MTANMVGPHPLAQCWLCTKTNFFRFGFTFSGFIFFAGKSITAQKWFIWNSDSYTRALIVMGNLIVALHAWPVCKESLAANENRTERNGTEPDSPLSQLICQSRLGQTKADRSHRPRFIGNELFAICPGTPPSPNPSPLLTPSRCLTLAYLVLPLPFQTVAVISTFSRWQTAH